MRLAPRLASLASLFLASPLVAQEALTEEDMFPTDRLIEVKIKVDEEDWDTIRNQTRNLLEVLNEKRRLAPIEGPYTYVPADVTIDGRTFKNVGLRKKGFIGSQSDSRPSLKVKLNFTDKKGGIGGLKNLTLNNNKQDATLVNQYMGYRLFNEAGAPAPRTCFAKVSVNGKNLGVYTHVETPRKNFVNREFGTKEGVLYEGTVVDFRKDWEGSFERKFGDKEDGQKKIVEMIKLLDGEGSSKQNLEAIGKLIDLDLFYRFWAVEGLVGFWDGYAANSNNFFVYLNPESNKFQFFPWGADALFSKYSMIDRRRDGPISVKTKGIVSYRLYQLEEGRARYAATMKKLLEEVWKEKELLAETDRLEKLLTPHLNDEQSSFSSSLDKVRQFIRTRRADIEKEVSGSMPKSDRFPDPPPVIPGSIEGLGGGDTLLNAAKKGDLPAIEKHLADGKDVNQKDLFGSSPLSLAALAGKTEAVKLLLEKGANPNIRGGDQGTPLHGAAFLGRLEVVKLLVEHKAELNVKNNRNDTPLDSSAAEWNEQLAGIVQFVGGLLQLKLDTEKIKAGRPKVAAYLREKGAKHGKDLSASGGGGDIWASAKSGDLKQLETLLTKEKVDPDGHDQHGLTPISYAALADKPKAIALLVKHGGKVNAPNRDGGTALHGAAFLGNVASIEVLLTNKADLSAKNGDGQTALDTAAAEWTQELQGFARLIAGFLQLEVDLEKAAEGRPKAAALLKKAQAKSELD